jgi:hypothetical protein
LSRRAIVAMHRQFLDELAAWAKRIPPFEPFDYFTDMAGNFVPFTKLPRVKPRPHVVFIDEDVTFREDAVRRLLADTEAHNLIFTDPGVLQVTDLNIDLAPELKELIGAGFDRLKEPG